MSATDAPSTRKALALCLNDPDWRIVGRLGALSLNRALRREVAAGHPLFNCEATAVARHTAGDDVLFGLKDGKVALVHLTWRPQTRPDWPATSFYDSARAFADMLARESTFVAAIHASLAAGADAQDGPLCCPDCGADWAKAEVGPDCAMCDGGALARACLHCDGLCGAVWRRAVLDSLDQGEAVWIGSCKLDHGGDRDSRT